MSESMAAPATSRPRTPVHLWIVGGLALLWNAFGAYDYLAHQLEIGAYLSQLTAAQVAYFANLPAWSVAAWAFGVWGGVAGALGLLLRRRWAVWAFALSIAGMVVNSIHTFFLSDGTALMGVANVAFSAVIWIVQVLLLLYANWMAKKGVLV